MIIFWNKDNSNNQHNINNKQNKSIINNLLKNINNLEVQSNVDIYYTKNEILSEESQEPQNSFISNDSFVELFKENESTEIESFSNNNIIKKENSFNNDIINNNNFTL